MCSPLLSIVRLDLHPIGARPVIRGTSLKLAALQLDLPLNLVDERRRLRAKTGMARWTADKAIDKIRERFG